MEHGKVDYDKTSPNAKALIVFLVLFAISLAVIYVGVFYLTKTTQDHTAITSLNDLGVPYEVEQLRNYEKQMLNEYGVIDADKEVYRIPIEKAMDKVIEDYR